MSCEVISRVERRRHWPTAEKLRIMSEALEPGATVAAVADRNGVCRSQIYSWLRLARNDRLSGISLSTQADARFVPARIEAPQVSSRTSCPPQLPKPACEIGATAPSGGRRQMEVVLTNGRILRVYDSIDPDALARLAEALEGVRSC